MEKKWFFLFLLLFSLPAFGQENVSKTYYQSYRLNFDKTDNLTEQVEPGNLKAGEFYFVAETKDNQPISLGYYDHQGNIQTYLLDRYYNLYFQYLTYEYEKGLLKAKFFKNASDFTLARIDYEYNEQKKISRTMLWTYSLLRREMVKISETLYTYNGENYEVVERFNTRDQTYERFFYRGGKALQEYERYDIDGKSLQYRVKFYYENNQLAKKEYYSRAGVLLRTIYEKNIASNA